jgi:hypothetical protein
MGHLGHPGSFVIAVALTRDRSIDGSESKDVDMRIPRGGDVGPGNNELSPVPCYRAYGFFEQILRAIRRWPMTQDSPVLAGLDNTAALTTGITASLGVASTGTAAFRVTNMTHGTGLQITSVDSETGLSISNRTVTGKGVTVNNESVDSGVGLAVTHVSNGMNGGIAISAFASSPGANALYAWGRNRGIYVVGNDGEAVRAYSYRNNGTHSFGQLNGVKGITGNPTGAGVWGQNTAAGQGVLGTSEGGTGVQGIGIGIGVHGRTDGGRFPAGVAGENASGSAIGMGVAALGGAGVGLVASGEQAAVRLVPAPNAGSPTTGSHMRGELVLDSNGDLFLCKVDGTPGTWVQIA